jgi:hypothetical protein
MANNSLTTDFNTSPYYDNYDEAKDFYRVLFKPGVSVQARELTQLQTTLQKQIDRFAEHIFKEGSLVTGGQFIFDQMYRYVKLADDDSLSNPISVSDFLGTEVTGQTTGVVAEVVKVTDGSDATSSPKTFFIKYKAAGSNGLIKAFAPGERLVNDDSFEAVILSANTAVGNSSIFTIEPGVIFAKDHMLRFDGQSIVLEPYSDKPSYKVGFNLVEETIDAIDDQTLLDPAQGSFNYAAPGADRLKITATLIKYPLNTNTSANFIELFEIKDGITQEKYERPQYSVIRDELAIRTNDDGGDFYVKGWNVFAREHLDNGSNQGLFHANTGGNSSYLAIGVDPGKGYVKGYDVETLVPRYLPILKGLDYNNVEQQVVSTNYSNYIIVDEMVGNWPINGVTTISLYSVAQDRISTNGFSAAAQTGTLIGTAKLKTIKHLSGVKGKAEAQYTVYIFDIKITHATLKFKDVRSIYINNSTSADAGADIVLDGGVAVLYEPDFNYGIYDIGLKSVKSIRDAANQIDTTYTYDKTFDVSIATNGTFSLSTGATDEIFSYSVGSLNSTQKNDFIVSLNSDVDVTMSGTVATSNGNTSVVGTGTSFTNLNVGDKITITDVTGIFKVASITNNTLLDVTVAPASTASGKAFEKNYYAGDVIDFNLKGAAAGVTRDISISTSTTATFDMKETLSTSVTATAIAKFNKVDAREIAKVYRPNRYVVINCAANTTGPYNLGISDVYKLRSVRLKTGAFSSVSEGTDVTSQFKLDNGQRDTHYDHASLIKAGASISNTTYLLAKLDYFSPDFSQGFGYFSVDSYPIDDVSSSSNTAIRTENIPVYISTTSGRRFDLRNCIDTRPVKTNTAADATVLGSATTNPATSSSFVAHAGGLRTASPNEQFLLDLAYYLPRNDILVVNKEGIFRTIQGTSSTLPITPSIPPDAMGLAIIRVSPYPSLVSSYATSIQRLDLATTTEKTSNRRYTHRDVGVLDDRIKNLEYYQALTLLEKSVIDLKIPDEDGLDRFKNGIFVDPFNDHSLGDLGNPDYDIAVDPIEKCIRPKFRSSAIGYNYKTGTNVAIRNNLVTLPYSEAVLISQLSATGTRNAAGFFWNFKGSVSLDPSQDYWTDTSTAPSIQVTAGPSAQAWQSLANAASSVYGDWNTTWTGVEQTSESAEGGTNVTATTTSTQSRSQTTVSVMLTTPTESLGDRIIDVGVIPFMRSRAVRFSARGMQPTTRVYPFFDGENVSAYCGSANSDYSVIGAPGSALITDASGVLYGVFVIPNNDQKRFRVGDRIFKLSDSLLNGSDALTIAQGTYSASGLNQQKQTTFLTTINPTFSSSTSTESRTVSSSSSTFVEDQASQTTVINNTIVQGNNNNGTANNDEFFFDSGNGSGGDDPIAQTFTIEVPQASHVFITSLDLYFQTKHSSLGVTVQLREVDSSGNITNKIIPYSTTYVPSASINVSNDSSAVTNIPLSGLVCLTSGQDYAFVILPEQNNPNYRLFTAKLGENDLLTGNRVTSQPYSGVFFASANNKTWSPIQDEDIKFKINRASFTSNNGTFRISNKQKEIFAAGTVSGTWTQGAELVYGETLLTLASVTGTTPIVGDKIVQDAVSASIISINGAVYRVRGTNAYTIGNGAVSFTDSSDVSTGATATVTNSATSYCEFETKYVNEDDETIFVMSNPTGKFIATERLTRSTGEYVEISAFRSEEYSVLDFETAVLEFPQTVVKWDNTGVDPDQNYDATATAIMPGRNIKLFEEKSIFGKTEEDDDLAGSSIYYDCQLYSISNYVSPLVDLNRTYTIYVKNLINNDVTGETGVTGGNCITKYISQKISLASDNDAEDLKVYLSSYKPAGSEIKVYAKLLNAEDIDNFETKSWFELEPKTTNVFSNNRNEKDYREFEYNIPVAMKTGPLGEVEYTNSTGIEFLGYRNYMIKICLTGTNSAIVPKVKDLRCLALQI